MASATLTRKIDVFGDGASVSAYARSNFPGSWDRSGAPAGSAAATASVQSDGSVTFTGLTDDTVYEAYANSRYVEFRTAPAAAASSVTDRGAWLASTAYAKGDRYTDPNGLRRDVTAAYSSGASFGATDVAVTSATGSADQTTVSSVEDHFICVPLITSNVGTVANPVTSPGTIILGSSGAAQQLTPLLLAPFSLIVRQVSLMAFVSPATSIALSDTNYFTAQLRRHRANVNVTIANKTMRSTSTGSGTQLQGQALARRTEWSFDTMDFDSTYTTLTKGDGLDIVWTIVGVPGNIDTALATVRFERLGD